MFEFIQRFWSLNETLRASKSDSAPPRGEAWEPRDDSWCPSGRVSYSLELAQRRLYCVGVLRNTARVILEERHQRHATNERNIISPQRTPVHRYPPMPLPTMSTIDLTECPERERLRPPQDSPAATRERAWIYTGIERARPLRAATRRVE